MAIDLLIFSGGGLAPSDRGKGWRIFRRLLGPPKNMVTLGSPIRFFLCVDWSWQPYHIVSVCWLVPHVSPAIGLCYVAIMSPARTVFNLALRAPLKRDRRRFNKGKDNRTRWTYHQKALAIEEFEELNIQKFVSQEEFCSKHKFNQGTFAKWRLKKKGRGE